MWASLEGAHPDGICLDAEGAVWYGDVPARRYVRALSGLAGGLGPLFGVSVLLILASGLYMS
jgi:streptogramin lyase